jgi:hypothetical protein
MPPPDDMSSRHLVYRLPPFNARSYLLTIPIHSYLISYMRHRAVIARLGHVRALTIACSGSPFSEPPTSFS